MSQAANIFSWNHSGSMWRVRSITNQCVRPHRLIDLLVLMIILAASGICASVYSRTSAELSAATDKHRALQDRLEQLRIETGRLERDIERLRTDPSFIEALARQNLGFIRPGEIVIRLKPDAAVGTSGERDVRVARLRGTAGRL